MPRLKKGRPTTSYCWEGAYHLRNTNAEKVKVAHSGELKDQLLWDEVPDRVARGADIVGDVGMASASVNQGLVVLNGQRNGAAILGCLDVLLSKNQLDNGRLVERNSGVFEAALKRHLGSGGIAVYGRRKDRAREVVGGSLLCRGEVAVGHVD